MHSEDTDRYTRCPNCEESMRTRRGHSDRGSGRSRPCLVGACSSSAGSGAASPRPLPSPREAASRPPCVSPPQFVASSCPTCWRRREGDFRT
eukprot:scaffold1880_cov211-Pinguiococcus_pyrenoidosus.AAC.3